MTEIHINDPQPFDDDIAVEKSLSKKKQSLILLPEISLTADLFKRIESRFGIKPVMWHSNLSKGKSMHCYVPYQSKLLTSASALSAQCNIMVI